MNLIKKILNSFNVSPPDFYIPLKSIEELREESKRTGVSLEILMARSIERSRESAQQGKRYYS